MENLHLQAPLLQVHTIHIGDLQFAAIGRDHVLGELHCAAIVEVKARDRIVRLRIFGLLLNGKSAACLLYTSRCV